MPTSDKKTEEVLNDRAQQEADKARTEEAARNRKKADKPEANVRTEADIARIDEVKSEIAKHKDEIAKLHAELSTLERKRPSKEEAKKEQEMIDNTDPLRTANENVEAGGHPTGNCPAGTT